LRNSKRRNVSSFVEPFSRAKLQEVQCCQAFVRIP
jgi:hypothetical protein